jgi:hypothetical protein
MVTHETQRFLDRFRPPGKDNTHISCVLILFMTIDVVVVVVLPWGTPALLLYP